VLPARPPSKVVHVDETGAVAGRTQ
jgi:hypothetical protein